jgi:hypothetical protein
VALLSAPTPQTVCAALLEVLASRSPRDVRRGLLPGDELLDPRVLPQRVEVGVDLGGGTTRPSSADGI